MLEILEESKRNKNSLVTFTMLYAKTKFTYMAILKKSYELRAGTDLFSRATSLMEPILKSWTLSGIL